MKRNQLAITALACGLLSFQAFGQDAASEHQAAHEDHLRWSADINGWLQSEKQAIKALEEQQNRVASQFLATIETCFLEGTCYRSCQNEIAKHEKEIGQDKEGDQESVENHSQLMEQHALQAAIHEKERQRHQQFLASIAAVPQLQN